MLFTLFALYYMIGLLKKLLEEIKFTHFKGFKENKDV